MEEIQSYHGLMRMKLLCEGSSYKIAMFLIYGNCFEKFKARSFNVYFWLAVKRRRKWQTDTSLSCHFSLILLPSFAFKESHKLANFDSRPAQMHVGIVIIVSLLKLHNVIMLCSFFSKTAPPILMKLCM